MTHMEISALEHASRTAMAWSPEGYDGRTHVRPLLVAAASAMAIVLSAATLLIAFV